MKYFKLKFAFSGKGDIITFIRMFMYSVPEANDSSEMFPFIFHSGNLLFNVTGPDLTADLDQLVTLVHKVIL